MSNKRSKRSLKDDSIPAPTRKKALEHLALMSKEDEYDYLIEYIGANPGVSNKQILKSLRYTFGSRKESGTYWTRRWNCIRTTLEIDPRINIMPKSARMVHYYLVEPTEAPLEVPNETNMERMKDSPVRVSLEGTLPDPIHLEILSPEGGLLTSGSFSGKAGVNLMDVDNARITVQVQRRSDGTTECHLTIVVE